MKGLYPIVDLDTCRSRRLDPRFVTEAVLEVAPSLLQLRAKSATSRRTLELLREMQAMVASTVTKLVANDRPDLALLARCAGVHLGQQDLRCEDVRALAPGILVGISTHSGPELAAALAERPDYVAFGPVFPTRSKRQPDPEVSAADLEQAREACRSASIPLVGIGGIGVANVDQVVGKVDLVAVISELHHEQREVIIERAKALHGAVVSR